ncbi:MAG: pilus assembly protein [Succinivibrionaceae bacterium]
MKLLKTVIAGLSLGASATGLFLSGTVAAATASDSVTPVNLAGYPLYVGGESLPALVMIMMSKDHSMYYEAYNDMTDLDGDNQIDGFFKPVITYDGLFDSSFCYTYSGTYFKISQKASKAVSDDGRTMYYCNKQWSGNFLNYVTTSRMDLVKRILMGGQRAYSSYKSDGYDYMNTTRNSGGYPILTRQWIPHDTHVWAKLFHPNDINKFCASGMTCSSQMFTPYANSGLLLGNTQSRMLVIVFSQSGNEYLNGVLPLASLTDFTNITSTVERDKYESKHVFIWNWLSRESGVGGGVGYSNGKTPITSPGASGEVKLGFDKYNVRVESCHPTGDIVDTDLGDRCESYSSGYNTVGLLQNFSNPKHKEAYFGLITATWGRTSDGVSSAALRAEMSDLSTVIDQTNGNFQKNSVLGVINNLGLVADNSTNYGSGWSDCKIKDHHDNRIYVEGRCQDWGNPLAQLIALSHDYFNGSLSGSGALLGSGSTEKSVKIRINNLSDDENSSVSIKLPDLKSVPSPYAQKGFYWCQTPINLLLMDESVSFDWKVNGYSSDIQEGFDIINAGEGLRDKYYIYGEKFGNGKVSLGETLPTLKLIENLAEVRGVSVIEPHFEGSLKGAALAAQYYAKKLTPTGAPDADSGKHPSIQNIVVSMASYLPQFTIYTGNNKKVLFIPICKSPRISGNSNPVKPNSSSILSTNYDKGEDYTASCSVGDVFYVGSTYNSSGKLSGVEFRTSYEDNEAGSDFDMDTGTSYLVEADPNNPDQILVTTKGYYSDGYAGQLVGFVLVGSEGIYSLDFDKKQSLVDTLGGSYFLPVNNLLNAQFHQDKRTYYFDISKSNGGNQVAASYTSDPFFEANYLAGGAKSALEISQSANGTTINDTDAHYCFRDTPSSLTFSGRPRYYLSNSTTLNDVALLPRVGAQAGGNTVYCTSSVKRTFYVPNGADGAFLESPLYYVAKYGYKKSDGSNYYYVTNASTLAENITQAMETAVSAGSKSSTAMSFSSIETSSDSAESIMAKFDSTYWTGDVAKVKISMTDAEVTSQSTVWSVADTMNAAGPALRKIYMARADGVLVEFTKDNLLNSSGEFSEDSANLMGTAFPRFNAGLTDTFGGLATCSAVEKAEFMEAYVKYVKGDHTYEVAEDADGTEANALNKCGVVGFHQRNGGILGAVISSTPQVVNLNSRKTVIFAANDGMVHFVNEETGEELFAIIPYVAQYGMPAVARKDTKTRYVLDGEIKVSTFKVGGSNRTIAIGSTGMTNPGLYAMELTDLNLDVHSVKMIWELTKSEEQGKIHHVNALGSFTESVNVFAHTVDLTGDSSVTKAYVVFGNGYNSNVNDAFVPFGTDSLGNEVQKKDYGTSPASNGESGLIVMNAFTGKVLSLTSANVTGMITNSTWSPADCLRSGTIASNPMYKFFYNDSTNKCYANGMNPAVAAYDADHDGSPDYVYSTDLYGNVYRTIMNRLPVSGWTMDKIHTTVREEGSTLSVEPITTRPALASGSAGLPFVVVGSGQYLTAEDVKNTDLQSMWGLDDAHYSTNGAIICNSDSVDALSTCRTSSKLYKMYMVNYAGSAPEYKNFRDIVLPTDSASGGTISYDADLYNGWIIDMSVEPGERVVVSPTVADKHVYVTTMIPSDNPCNAGGSGHMYDLNILTGTFYQSPEKSQLYSDQIMSKSTLTYSKGMTEEERKSSATTDAPRKRGSNSYGCASVSNWTQINGGEAKKMVGPQYCPRVESWQYIFD